MQRAGVKTRGNLGRIQFLLAFICLTVLICGLLVTNYLTQNSLQRANINRFQQNFEKSTATISYFFSERENDILGLSTSNTVTGFFSNRNLGMSMAYGLRSSLDNVTQLFKSRIASACIGEKPIYSRLALLETDGKVLSKWPANEIIAYRPLPEEVAASPVTVDSQAYGSISFIAPIFLHTELQGYILGEVSYDTLTDYLLGGTPGLLFIAGHGKLLFQSQPEITILTDALDTFGHSGIAWPLELNRNDFIEPPATKRADNIPFTLFFSAIPKYNINVYVAENSRNISSRQSLFLFMAVLAALSVGVLLVAGTLLRVNTRNLVLETSLGEAEKREQAVAEKMEELKLVIDGARLGTWNWNIESGELIFNERWMAMLGYEMGELDPHIDTWKDLVHPDDYAMVMKNLQAHLKGETTVYSIEHRLRHKTGKWIWVLDAGGVLRRDQTGNPLRALGIHLDLTEQKESQQLLSKAKTESDTIISNFLDTLIVVGKNLTVVRVNQATCQLLGYCEKELLGRPITALFHDPEDVVQSFFSFYANVDTDLLANRKELRNVELCYRAKNGGKMQMSFNISVLNDDKGEVTGVVAGAKDISNLISAIDEINSQKEYIENIFDVVPEGLLAIAPSLEIRASNKAFRNIIRTWAIRFAMKQSALIEELLVKLEQAHLEKKELVFALTHNGVTAFFQRNTSVVLSSQGIEHVVAVRDITEQREAEAARHLLASVIEQTGDSVIITEPNGVILYVNPAVVQTSGYSKSELLGQKTSVLKSNQNDPAIFREMWRTITQGKVWLGRIKSKNKDNTPIEEDVTISPVRNEEGVITNYVAIMRDVTQIDFLQKQLLKARKMETIGLLAAGIAHEINTPMQYVQNNISFLDCSFEDIATLIRDYQKILETSGVRLTKEAGKHLADINLEFLLGEIPESISETYSGIDRVVEIVSALKEFSHPGSHDKIATDINHVLESTIAVSRNEWKYVAEMETDFDPNLPLVFCLPSQLSQAILNLIVNSAHAIEETGASVPDTPGRISISTRHDAEWVEIRVSDTGGGIPEEIRERIFDPFFTTKDVGKGTGQGLSIAHGVIVNKHGGDIDFITDLGKGTTFILRLPINTIEKDKDEE